MCEAGRVLHGPPGTHREDVIGLCDGDVPQGPTLLRFLKGIGAHGRKGKYRPARASVPGMLTVTDTEAKDEQAIWRDKRSAFG